MDARGDAARPRRFRDRRRTVVGSRFGRFGQSENVHPVTRVHGRRDDARPTYRSRTGIAARDGKRVRRAARDPTFHHQRHGRGDRTRSWCKAADRARPIMSGAAATCPSPEVPIGPRGPCSRSRAPRPRADCSFAQNGGSGVNPPRTAQTVRRPLRRHGGARGAKPHRTTLVHSLFTVRYPHPVIAAARVRDRRGSDTERGLRSSACRRSTRARCRSMVGGSRRARCHLRSCRG